jgi:hypothetical protein
VRFPADGLAIACLANRPDIEPGTLAIATAAMVFGSAPTPPEN